MSEDKVRYQPHPEFEPEQRAFFAQCLRALNEGGIPYLIAGALAKHAYTGIWRDTKDLDIFLKAADLGPVLELIEQQGCNTTIVYPHWLAKAHQKPYFIDFIFGMGHGHLQVEESWFQNKRPYQIAGEETFLIPPEELIVSKVYVVERYRCDVADVAHVIQRTKGQLDWERILSLLHEHRELLLWHLLFFNFIYPEHAGYLPQDLMATLFEEVRRQWQNPPANETFRGALLDPHSFAVDIESWEYPDPRNLEAPVDEESGKLL